MRLAAVLGLALLSPALLVQHARADEEPSERTDEGGDPNAPPEHLGPVELETEAATLRLGFGTQLRATTLGAFGGDHEGRVTLHRARPALGASFLDGRLRFRLHLDVAPRALELLDLFLEGDPSASTVLRVGIAKVPFTLYWDQSYLRLALVDWPLATRWLGGGRQLGVTFLTRPAPHQSGWFAAIGLYQGQTLRHANGQRFTTAYGEKPTNALDLREHTPLGRPHPEIVGRLGYRHHREGLEAAIALSAAWDLRPTYAVDETLRMALDGHLLTPRANLRAGGYLAIAEDGAGDPMLAYGASLVELEIRPHARVGLAARHSAVVRSRALREDARTRAEGLIASAVDDQERQAMESRYANVDRIRAEHETSLGLNLYLIGDDLKLQLDASWLRTSGAEGSPNRDGWRARAQLGLAF